MLKIPPYNQEAEQAILGMMFSNPDIIPQVKSYLVSPNFYAEKHQIIAEAFFTLPRGQADLVCVIAH